jgi:outer membrane protein assembly factor BamB
MSLKGDLSTIGLGEVFQMISMSQKEGTLVVQDADSRKAIYFGKEGVQLLSTGRRKGIRIGDILVRAGKISPEKLEEVLDRQKTSHRLLGEELVNSGHVSRKDIQEVVRGQIEEEIYDLFLWKKASFEFIEGQALEELQDPDSRVIRLSFDLNMLLLEAVRRTDEWTRINQRIPGMDCVMEFSSLEAKERETASASPESRGVLERLDGLTSIHDLLEITLRPRFEVCHLLLSMLERGSVQMVDVAGMVEKARQLISDGDPERGLRLFNAAALQNTEDVDVMSGFAHALETQGLLQDAARVYVKIGLQLESEGRAQEGVAYFQRAVALVPNDPQSKIALFGVSLASGNVEEALQTAREVVRSSLESKDYDTARTVAEKGVAAAPQDLTMRVALAKAYHGLGMRRECDDVVKYIHKNLPVDQAQSGRILADLQTVTAPGPMTVAIRAAAARRRGRKKALLPVAIVVGVILIGGVIYEVMAGTEFSRLDLEARSLEDRGRLEEARDRLARFTQGMYQYSLLTAGKARERLDELEARILKPVTSNGGKPPPKDPKVEAAEKAAEAKRRLEARMQELERNIVEFKNLGQMSKALEAARELLEIAGRVKDETRLRFAREHEAAIRTYEEEAKHLQDQAAAYEAAGRYAAAAEKISEIFRRYQWSASAVSLTYPLIIRVNIPGVEVQRDGRPIETSAGKDIVLRLANGEKPFRLTFTRKGYRQKAVEVPNLVVGLVAVRMDEKEAEWQFPLGAAMAAAPIVDGEVLYVRTRDQIIALASDNPRVRWKVKVEGSPGTSMKLVDGLIYTASGKAVLVLDPAKPDGQNLLRQMSVDQPIVGALGFSAARDVIYFGTADRYVVALHAQTGAIVWKRQFPREVVAEPVEYEGAVIVCARDGKIRAVKGAEQGDPDANLVWQVPVSGEIECAPLIHDGRAYVGTLDGRVLAIELSDRKIKWARPLESGVLATPVLAGSLLAVPTKGGALVALDLNSGEPQWTSKTDGPIRSSPVAADGRIFFGSEDRKFTAVTEKGELLWRFPAARAIVAAAALADGRVYVGSDDQLLYAIRLD